MASFPAWSGWFWVVSSRCIQSQLLRVWIVHSVLNPIHRFNYSEVAEVWQRLANHQSNIIFLFSFLEFMGWERKHIKKIREGNMLFHVELNIYNDHCVLAHCNNASFWAKVAIVIIPLNSLNSVIMVSDTFQEGLSVGFLMWKETVTFQITGFHLVEGKFLNQSLPVDYQVSLIFKKFL